MGFEGLFGGKKKAYTPKDFEAEAPQPPNDSEIVSEPLEATETEDISAPKPEREKTPAERELADLHELYRQLELVENSIEIERNGVGKAWSDAESAKETSEHASKELIEKGIIRPLEESDKEMLRAATAQEADARAWQQQMQEFQSAQLEYGRHGSLIEGPFAEKLRSLGVDVESIGTGKYGRFSSTPQGEVLSAITSRMFEVEREINQKRLEIVGGKEEMIGELIRKRNLLDDASIAQIQRDVPTLRTGHVRVQQLAEALERGLKEQYISNTYPEAVTEGVKARLLHEVLVRQNPEDSSTQERFAQQTLAEYASALAEVREQEKHLRTLKEALPGTMFEKTTEHVKSTLHALESVIDSDEWHTAPEDTRFTFSPSSTGGKAYFHGTSATDRSLISVLYTPRLYELFPADKEFTHQEIVQKVTLEVEQLRTTLRTLETEGQKLHRLQEVAQEIGGRTVPTA